MLEFELTPHHAGLALWGAHAALERLHGFVHRIVDESHLIEDKEGFVLGLGVVPDPAFDSNRPFLLALQAIVAGSRDPALAVEPKLDGRLAAEVLFLIETLEQPESKGMTPPKFRS